MNMTETKTIRLLIVEDHEITRLGLCTLLRSCPQFEIVGEGGSVAQALDAVTRLKPDLLLLDLRLPDGSGSAGVLETAPESRAAVQVGETYTLWFLARGDASWSEASATVSLVWHPNNNNNATVGDPTNLDLTLPVRVSTDDPMQTFHVTAVAPPGANYASVRVTKPPYDYAPIIFDDFVIMAEPAEVSLSIKKNGPNAELTWPRSFKHRLEMNDSPALSNGWSVVDKPTKGIGAKNRVDCPLTEPVRFFRLTTSD
jgi:hypothetical protein